MPRRRFCRQGCVDEAGNAVPFKGEGCIHRKTKKTAPAATSEDGPSFIPDASGCGINGLPRFAPPITSPSRPSAPALPRTSTSPMPAAELHNFNFDLLISEPAVPTVTADRAYDWPVTWDHSVNLPILEDTVDGAGTSDGMFDPLSFDSDVFVPPSPMLPPSSSESGSLPPVTPDSSDFNMDTISDGPCAPALQQFDKADLTEILSSLEAMPSFHEASMPFSDDVASLLDFLTVSAAVPCVWAEAMNHYLLDVCSEGVPSVPGEARIVDEAQASQTLPIAADKVTARRAKKRKKVSRSKGSDFESDGDLDQESDEGYIEDDIRRAKRHSERLQRIIEKLDRKCRPYILFYVARPESILMRNGKARFWTSRVMKDALGANGDNFADGLHAIARGHTEHQMASPERIAALNQQVHAAQEERRKLEHQVAVLQKQMEDERAHRAGVESQLDSMQATQ
ncbi:hypothetical protein D9615_007540 [Tricholomella constricta]|uniref:Uncharacterized protein n=1 Tax=Tricholomella constricta TaxID=117010 RepID=A0A8H5H816_9AGAR|nr:hypothetical protein D9615_007540 [Tricholomella constricta]